MKEGVGSHAYDLRGEHAESLPERSSSLLDLFIRRMGARLSVGRIGLMGALVRVERNRLMVAWHEAAPLGMASSRAVCHGRASGID